MRAGAPAALIPDNADRLLEDLIESALKEGAAYAEATILHQRSQSLQARKTDLSPAGEASSSGIALRVWSGSGWGFSATSRLNALRPAAMASSAVSMAKAVGMSSPGQFVRERRVATSESWTTPGASDPFAVPFREKKEFLLGLTRPPLDHPQIAFSVANLFQVKRESQYRNSIGGATKQTSYICYPNFAVTAFDKQKRTIDSRSSFLEAGGYGWEITSGHDFKSELDTAVQEVLKTQAAEPVNDGRAALVIDASALWHIVYETIAHHLDPRNALGLDGRHPADRWITPDLIGRADIGSSSLTVGFDSSLARGLATSGWDDAGMPAASGVLIENGIIQNMPGAEDSTLPGTPPEYLHARMSGWNTPPAFAMPNIVLRSTSEKRLDDLIADSTSGYLVKGRGQVLINSAHTMFRYRPQLAWRIEGGRVGAMVRDLEIETSVEQFWQALVDVGAESGRLTAGDLFPQNRNALWDSPFSISAPPARFSELPIFRTQRG